MKFNLITGKYIRRRLRGGENHLALAPPYPELIFLLLSHLKSTRGRGC